MTYHPTRRPMGRPMTLRGPIGDLARAMGGVKVLAKAMHTDPRRIRAWANERVLPNPQAWMLLTHLAGRHGIRMPARTRGEDFRDRTAALAALAARPGHVLLTERDEDGPIYLLTTATQATTDWGRPEPHVHDLIARGGAEDAPQEHM